MADSNPEESAAHGQPAATENSEDLPLLSGLGQGGSTAKAGHSMHRPSRGFVSVLIVGAVALVVALVALVIAFGRGPSSSSAAAASSGGRIQMPATTYASPSATGTRWTPEPIVTGQPQKGTAPESSSSEDLASGDEDEESIEPQSTETGSAEALTGESSDSNGALSGQTATEDEP